MDKDNANKPVVSGTAATSTGYVNVISLEPMPVDEIATADKSDFPDADDFEEENIRGNWSHHIEFILSVIGYAVGLGNVWRFPFQCYKYGGGAFLCAYWTLSFCVGFPMVFFEQSLGQYTSQGPMHCWGFAPIVRGIGYSMSAISAINCINYNVIIAWSIFMLFASFQSVLPWADCDFDSWANYRCEMKRTTCNSSFPDEVRGTDGLCYNTTFLSDLLDPLASFNLVACPEVAKDLYSESYYGDRCLNFQTAPDRNTSNVLGYWNETIAIKNEVSPQLSTEQYFYSYVLRLSDEYNTENIGTPSWGLVLSLLLAWIFVFFCLMNGIKSSGKVVYFTAVFPYVILFVLIGRGVTLPGAYEGIMFYITPRFDLLRQPRVWFAAANQLFYSLGIAWGGMTALASYNKFDNNALRDALITVLADSGTSFIAGFAIFSIIGYGSHVLQQPVDKVAQAGTGLAFVMYPKVVLEMPGSVAWAIAFFFMLLLLGLDSEFNTMETVLTALLDHAPYFRRSLRRKALFLGCICLFFFGLAIPMVCNGGSYLLVMVDEYSAGWGALVAGVIEILSFSWLYGTFVYDKDLKLMIGSSWTVVGRWYIAIFWRVISPGIVLFILVYACYSFESSSLTTTNEVLGWCCTVFVLMWPPVFVIYELVTATPGSSLWQRIREKTSPSKEWGPYFVKDRLRVTHLGPNFDVDPRGVLKRRRKTASQPRLSRGDNLGYLPDYDDITSAANLDDTRF